MSGHDTAPDPIDEAYVQAEAVLSDDAARAARRARVLAAVAAEPTKPVAAPSPARRRPARRRDGWLAAACVAGLGLFLAMRLEQPVPRPPPPRPQSAEPAPSTAAKPGFAAAPAPHVHTARRAPKASRPAPRVTAPVARGPVAETAPAPATASAPPPAPIPLAPAPQAIPAAPSGVVREVVVTGSRVRRPPADRPDITSNYAYDRTSVAKRMGPAEPAPPPPPPAPPPAAALLGSPPPASPPGLAAKLAAAAVAGRANEVKALLVQGVPVDATDADGDTALMKSIRADRPKVAALLRRHGASLDVRNRAGESARDLAAAKGDSRLNRALGLEP